MKLQEFYDKALKLGATPDSEIIVEYCNTDDIRVINGKIFID